MSKKQTKIPDLTMPIPGETVHEYIEQRIKDAINLGALKQSVASTRKDEDGGLTTRAKADAAEVIPPLRAGEPSAALTKMRNQYCLHFDDLLNAYAEVLARSCSHRSGIQAVVESLRDEIIPERMIISSQSVVHAADLRLFFREILGGAVEEAGVPTREDGNGVALSPASTPASVCIWTHESIAGGHEKPINTYRRSCDQNRCTIYHSIERCTGCGKEISINGGLP